MDAGQLFRSVGMAEVADDVPDVAELRAALHAERLWVAQVDDEVAGYVTAEVLDGNAHIAQVSVARQFAGHALGARLIEYVEAWGRDAGRPATTLTTFRGVPWNGPYYRRLGYREIHGGGIGPELALTMAHEATLPGIDASLRCAMVKNN